MSKKIAIIRLGYVGLTYCSWCSSRIDLLQIDYDSILEVTDKNLLFVQDNIKYTNKIDEIKDCNVYIVTVPTPIDNVNWPKADKYNLIDTNI